MVPEKRRTRPTQAGTHRASFPQSRSLRRACHYLPPSPHPPSHILSRHPCPSFPCWIQPHGTALQGATALPKIPTCRSSLAMATSCMRAGANKLDAEGTNTMPAHHSRHAEKRQGARGGTERANTLHVTGGSCWSCDECLTLELPLCYLSAAEVARLVAVAVAGPPVVSYYLTNILSLHISQVPCAKKGLRCLLPPYGVRKPLQARYKTLRAPEHGTIQPTEPGARAREAITNRCHCTYTHAPRAPRVPSSWPYGCLRCGHWAAGKRPRDKGQCKRPKKTQPSK
ncbi:hypothetical protein B0T17DRAFT_395695 [Bombardia bombarda]|uniref:Uncharacterized protein n=1 Tax=Bombardia bombarda TaxID=252184 RepID=A0AA39TMU2_9PEZI|nr:hypothetical protein B0T17DRAFT_395695 [Bombardia bombarda]